MLVNSIFFIDLYLIIKNPFVPRESRMKWYLAFIVTFMLLKVITDIVENSNVKFAEYIQDGGENVKRVGTFFLATFAFVTIPTIVIIIKRLLVKSTSRDLKTKILKRYILYFLFYLIFMIQTILQFVESYLKINSEMDLSMKTKLYLADSFL